MESVEHIFAVWHLTETEQSALLRRHEFASSGSLPKRLVLFESIARSLEILYAREDLIGNWLRSPNRHELFHGSPPLDVMCLSENEDLERIAALLRAWSAGN